MSRTIDAVYENGVLRPLSPLDLREHQVVSLVFAEEQEPSIDPLQYFRQRAKSLPPPPGRAEIRRRLASIPGSLTEDFIGERGDR